MNRIEEKLNHNKTKALITYITAGLPDLETTKKLVKAQQAGGVDVIELGVPFSDPIADGPVIQAASYEAIQNGATLKKIFKCMEEMRSEGVTVPIIFMMYYNTILHYGIKEFADKCKNAGVDGLIVPDLPFEEQDELADALGDDGNVQLAHSISAGLDYPGVGPEHAYLRDSGRADYVSVTDKEAMDALMELTRLEGIIPAIESSHAMAYAFKKAKEMSKDQSMIVCLSGRGDKDVNTISDYLAGKGYLN